MNLMNMNGINMNSGDPDRARRTQEGIDSGVYKTDTPRCDVAMHTHPHYQNTIPLEFACQLEVELNEANRKLAGNVSPTPIFWEVLSELDRATKKFPTWPTDPLHALAVLGEEYGELTQAVLQTTYEPAKSSTKEVRKEAIQTAAMALRFVMSLDVYEYKAGLQHEQQRRVGCAACDRGDFQLGHADGCPNA